MALVKLLILLRGSHLAEARPYSVCLLSAAQLGTHVCKLSVRAKTGLFSATAHTKPANYSTSSIAMHSRGVTEDQIQKAPSCPNLI